MLKFPTLTILLSAMFAGGVYIAPVAADVITSNDAIIVTGGRNRTVDRDSDRNSVSTINNSGINRVDDSGFNSRGNVSIVNRNNGYNAPDTGSTVVTPDRLDPLNGGPVTGQQPDSTIIIDDRGAAPGSRTIIVPPAYGRTPYN